MKYQNTTIIEIAQKRGSSAKTKAGAWKYLRQNLQKFRAARPARLYYPAIEYGRDMAALQKYREAQLGRRAEKIASALGYDPDDPNTPGNIMDRAYEEHRQWIDRCKWVLYRSAYGEICLQKYTSNPTPHPLPEVERYIAAQELLSDARRKKLIPFAYDTIEWDKKRRADGAALHHEIYDFRKNAVLVCLRRTEGTRYGVKTLSKTYMLIESYRRKITATETKEPVAKLAKTKPVYGSIIARVKGERGAAVLKIADPIDSAEAYKALAVVGGTLRSIYSGEEYKIGELKRQRAIAGHNGGYYCYPSIDEAASCEVPSNSKHQYEPRVIAKCLVGGMARTYESRKVARTYLRPIKIVASVLE